ncbi:MAG: hypothetical protein JW904_01520 [Spirochaetales bacterium]|nr:hypothetical protein [Spirochaetales bacterium]
MIVPGFIWFLTGCMLLNILLIFVYRTDIVHAARKRDGTVKKKIPASGLLSMGIFLLFSGMYFLVFNFIFFQQYTENSFLYIFSANLVLISLLSLYDAFVLDIFVLAVWRPAFLHIPQELTVKSMTQHIRKQMTIGWLIKVPVAAASAFFFWIINL